jgi:hypothetical protein
VVKSLKRENLLVQKTRSVKVSPSKEAKERVDVVENK